MMFEALSYRDNQGGLRLRRHELLGARTRELSSLPRDVARAYTRRISRIAGGVVAIVGAVLTVVIAVLDHGADAVLGDAIVKLPLTPFLLAGAVLSVPVMIFARGAARASLAMHLRRGLETTDDAAYDVSRLEESGPLRWASARADRLEQLSVAVPLAAWCLCAPLLSHFLVFLCFTDGRFERAVNEFDTWILVSMLLTGIAHAVLVFCAVRFARNLRKSNDSAAVPVPSSWAPLGWTALAGCVPGVVLYLVPPAMVVVTGLAFVPAVFAFIRSRVLAERSALALALADEPRVDVGVMRA
jgi:hypothetical protein